MRLFLKSVSIILIFGLAGTLPTYAANVTVDYDQQKDRIQVQATNASLTNVLAQIAKETGMEIQIDPAVEKTVNFQLRYQPLQQALQKVCKGLSYVIEYKTDARQQTVISGMKLLPKGIQDSGQLVPVSVLNAKASQNGGGGASNYDQSTNDRVRHYSGSLYPKAIRKPRLPVNHRQNLTADELTAPADVAAGDRQVASDDDTPGEQRVRRAGNGSQTESLKQPTKQQTTTRSTKNPVDVNAN